MSSSRFLESGWTDASSSTRPRSNTSLQVDQQKPRSFLSVQTGWGEEMTSSEGLLKANPSSRRHGILTTLTCVMTLVLLILGIIGIALLVSYRDEITTSQLHGDNDDCKGSDQERWKCGSQFQLNPSDCPALISAPGLSESVSESLSLCYMHQCLYFKEWPTSLLSEFPCQGLTSSPWAPVQHASHCLDLLSSDTSSSDHQLERTTLKTSIYCLSASQPVCIYEDQCSEFSFTTPTPSSPSSQAKPFKTFTNKAAASSTNTVVDTADVSFEGDNIYAHGAELVLVNYDD